MFEDRNVDFIRHFRTPTLGFPTAKQMKSFQRLPHLWTLGDRYYKLAYTHYQEPEYWWVIAWFNQKPTEAHVSVGETVYIPMPLEAILTYIYGSIM